MVKKVKIGVVKSFFKYKCFTVDVRDTLFFEDRFVVLKGDFRKVIMEEVYNFLFFIYSGRFKMYYDLK